MESQSDSSAKTSQNSTNAHLERRLKLIISITSAPISSAAPDSLAATHKTSSYEKSRSTFSGTYLYLLKAARARSSTGGNLVLGWFSQRTSIPVFSVLVQESSSNRHPPPAYTVTQKTAWNILPNRTMLWKSLVRPP